MTHNDVAAAFVDAFAREGSRALIANLATRVTLHDWGGTALPTTVNDGEPADTFVCSPRVAYRDYLLEELDRFPNRALAPALGLVVRGVGAILRPAALDRIVHVNNWMMSTNPRATLDPALVPAQTDALTGAHPEHIIAIRSLTRDTDATLLDALAGAGWTLLPSRQVFVVDDVARDGVPRRDTRRDERLWQARDLDYAELDAVGAADADRIAALYALLYRDKYSRLNPAFTPRFIAMTAAIGLIRYLVLRDRAGVIQAFGGMMAGGGHATMPLLGYDTAAPVERGLYRLAFHAGTRFAVRHGLAFNMSSGATAFKRNRGARAVMEYTAYQVRHLPRRRRYPIALLERVARSVGEPLLRRYGL